MISKKIHYVWFGHNEESELLKKCKESWRTFLPEYEIQRWDESNFDIDCCDYVRQAYDAKKWAFVADYARLWILYHYGGIYLDSDVEVFKSFDAFLPHTAFTCFETNSLDIEAAVLASEPGFEIWKEVLDELNQEQFVLPGGQFNQLVIPTRIMRVCEKRGLVKNNEKQIVDGLQVYPFDYFSAHDTSTGQKLITENTHAIHLYSATWFDEQGLNYRKYKQKYGKRYKLMFFLHHPFKAMKYFFVQKKRKKLQKKGNK